MLGNLNAKVFQEENRTILGAVEGTIMENETQTRPLVLNLLKVHRKWTERVVGWLKKLFSVSKIHLLLI